MEGRRNIVVVGEFMQRVRFRRLTIHGLRHITLTE
jgi:glycine/D-amino acid oxidase-like deaminating enzyme